MEMRAIEDIAFGQDLTPPLRPIAAVLRDSALSSNCSACFSTLPAQSFPPFTPAVPPYSHHAPSDSPTPLYCSPDCSSYDSPLHLSSGEAQLLYLFLQSHPSTWNDSSDLRLSLRLVSIFQKLPEKHSFSPRFSISSDQKVFLGGTKDNPFQESANIEGPAGYLEKHDDPWENMEKCCQNDAVRERIAGLLTNREQLVFRQNKNNPDEDNSNENNEILERIKEGTKIVAKARRMCLDEDKQEDFVLDEMILCLVLTNGVEVQDKRGCIIGVAVYDTAFSWINHSCSPNACYRFLVGLEDNVQSPLKITSAVKSGCGNGLIMEGDVNLFAGGGEKNGYGPRVVVRSIKDVKKGEEVTIAYTDLLQPKDMRRAELWFKYRFSCSCKRCDATPAMYVDNALQALSAVDPDASSKSSGNKIEKLIQSSDDAINDYLSLDDPISCCKKLECLLVHGHLIEPNEPKSPQKLKPHIFHHLSLNAYTTLASAYKVRAYDLSARNLEAFDMYRTSAAYSLLLAGGAHHLFTYESAFIATAANFWTIAGESLLDFAGSASWGPFSSVATEKCDNCCLANRDMETEGIGRRVFNCIVEITRRVWSVLASESSFLKVIRNPIDFGWLELQETCTVLESSGMEDGECDEQQARMNVSLLGVHCLRYGALLSRVCYGLSAELNYDYRILAFFKESA